MSTMPSVTQESLPRGKARKLWLLLARTLHKQKCPQDENVVSVRRVNHFGLLDIVQQESLFVYSLNMKKADECYHVKIRHVELSLTANHLMGFNNTGNICVWPSEEVLSYYCLDNSYLFNNKTVLELGGGMTCLAGLLIAKYLSPCYVLLSDGNATSVDNVKSIIELNQVVADSCVLEWGCFSKHHKAYFDIILAADCLFFDETRMDFVCTIVHCLNDSGIALITAPSRGKTLDLFVECAQSAGLFTLVLSCYNNTIWNQHCSLKLNNPHYDESIHYPILIIVSKETSSLLPFQI